MQTLVQRPRRRVVIRSLLSAVGLSLLSAVCLLAPAQEMPDVRRAEWTIEEARADLEEIVGPRLLGLDPPPLPEVPPLELGEADEGLVRRLADTPIAEWGDGERARLTEVLAREAAGLSAAGARGEPVAWPELADRGFALLKVSRLLALRDRLALLEGRESAFAGGLEERLDLSHRLALQPEVLGALLGNPLFVQVVEDVRAATARSETSAETLERLEALLFQWRLEAPDPAAILAREALSSLERTEREARARAPATEAAALPAFHAPFVEAMAELARRCRRDGCREAVAAVTNAARDRDPDDQDPYQVIADLMIPNYIDTLRKLAGRQELGRVAGVAVALRLEALERGSYPPGLERLAPELGLSSEHEAELAYERLPDGGARVRLVPQDLVTDQLERNRPRYRRLLAWELPPVAKAP